MRRTTVQSMRPGRCYAIALALLAAACAARRPAAPPDPFAGHAVRTLSPPELARAIDAEAAAVVSLRGKLGLELEAEGAGRRSCRGALAARNPWTAPSPGLYVQGTRALLPTLFTLVSDADRFWLHVPSERVVYTGPLAAAPGSLRAPGGRALPIDARDLLRALFVEPIGGAAVEVEAAPAVYLVSVRRDGQVRRRLWVERRRLAVERERFYGADGREELEIERGRWTDADDGLRAERLVVRDRAGGGTIRLDFDALAVNPAGLDGRAFRPRLPPGARVVEVAAEEERK